MTNSDTSGSGERARVLVVDDEPHIGLILRTRLEQGPYSVLLAGDGPEAFRQLEAHEDIALVILDLMLPGMNGIEILGLIRADARWRDLPVVILTAAGQEAQLQKAESLSVAAVLTKPFSPRRLYERVVTLTTRSPSTPRTTSEDVVSESQSLPS